MRELMRCHANARVRRAQGIGISYWAPRTAASWSNLSRQASSTSSGTHICMDAAASPASWTPGMHGNSVPSGSQHEDYSSTSGTYDSLRRVIGIQEYHEALTRVRGADVLAILIFFKSSLLLIVLLLLARHHDVQSSPF